MNVVDAKIELIKHDADPLAIIERVGRVCYKSEDKITEDSKYDFVKKLIDRRHYAMLEHEHLYFTMKGFDYVRIENAISDLDKHPDYPIGNGRYLNIGYYYDEDMVEDCVVSGSIRAFMEFFDKAIRFDFTEYSEEVKDDFSAVYYMLNQCIEKVTGIFDIVYSSFDVDYSGSIRLCDNRQEFIDFCNDYPYVQIENHLCHTVSFTCDRGVTHEIVRHRPTSFGQESTRYCNYGQAKYGDEITVIKPLFFEEGTEQYEDWKKAMEVCEEVYIDLTKRLKAQAQEARSVLPNSLKSEIVVTAVETQWQHILNLRYHGTTGAPHPQMKEVMTLAYEELTTDPQVTILK